MVMNVTSARRQASLHAEPSGEVQVVHPTRRGWLIWPSALCWGDLERPVRTSVLVALALYLLVVAAGFFKPGPTRKDMMMFEFARAHVELGVAGSRGFNLSTKWSTSPSEVRMGERNVYVSAPPLYPLLCAATYKLGGQEWRALRLAPMLLGLLYLYSCLALACKCLRGAARGWLMYLALSPMILIYATDLEINCGHLGLAVLSYLCFMNYLETARSRWMLGAGALYLVAFWSSFIAFSILPAMFVQLLLHRGLKPRERRRGAFLWLGAVGLGFAVTLVHLALLPGALEWAASRITERTSTSLEPGAAHAITPSAFIVRQGIRLATHYTPVCVLLAAGALVFAVREVWKATAARTSDRPQPVRPTAVLLQFLTWGLPSGVVAVNLAYVHPHYLYYFAVFFAFGSALGLQWIAERVTSTSVRNAVVGGVLGLFLLLTLSRSVFAAAGGSLPALFGPYLPSFVTERWNLGNDTNRGPIVVPPELW
jgi:hypothetical protein